MGYIQPSMDRMVGAYPTCGICGSDQIQQEAFTKWSRVRLEWELTSTLDVFFCEVCGLRGGPAWKLDEMFRRKRICRLNDELRRSPGENDMVVVTTGVQTLGPEVIADVSALVAAFEAFTGDNDPHAEHDFGAITLDGQKLFWKIDYFDRRLKTHSPDAANPDVTCRVLTIMLASEY